MMYLLRFIMICIWVTGVVIAKGFWSTFFAFLVPFWGWYLIAERLLSHYGIIGDGNLGVLL